AVLLLGLVSFFFSSRRRHTRCYRDWSSDVCSSDLVCFLFLVGLSFFTCDPDEEQEANWLAGCLLLPRDLLVRSLRSGLDAVAIRSEERRVGKECRSRGRRVADRKKIKRPTQGGWST